MSLLRRTFRFVFLGLLGLILSFYLIFAVGLKALEVIVTKNSEQASESLATRSKAPHRLRHYDQGATSFYRRLQLIEGAKKTIELEFFIFDIDEASRLLTQALVKKAKEGVEIRILVDFSAPVFQLKPVYARFLAERGIKVRYYNTSSAYRLVSIQHRSHRKLLIIDGETVITGGRNIANDYFDLSPRYNFLDSDLEVSGPVVKTVLASFDVYWNSRLSVDPETALERDPEAEKFFLPLEADLAILEKIKNLGEAYLRDHPAFTCGDLAFVTDFPNHGEASRKVFSSIVEVLGEAKKSVVVESPYFVIKSGGYEVLESLKKRNVSLTVLTNSLASTDADYAVAALYPRLGALADAGLSLYAYKGAPLSGQSSSVSGEESRWGVHSKRAVIDGETTLLGTYNVDPRSANLNSELMLVCRGGKDLAMAVSASIQARQGASHLVIDQGKLVGRALLLDNTSFAQRLRLFAEIPVANLFDFLL
jgi:putative cardiolipin synthase